MRPPSRFSGKVAALLISGCLLAGWLLSVAATPVLADSGPQQSAGDAPQISAAERYTCALTSAGGVKCWGTKAYGGLGDGTTTFSTTPVDVSGLSSGVAAISTGAGRFSSSGTHTCALTDAGGLKCWGWDFDGQLGDGPLPPLVSDPCFDFECPPPPTRQLSDFLSTTPVDVSELASGASAVSAGHDYTCAVTTTGGAKCWGSNEYGRLGDGTRTTRDEPVDVSGLTSGVAAISTGMFNTCALTTAGGVKCWGNNTDGRLGNQTRTSSFTPVDVWGLTAGVVAITVGDSHTCALTTAGGVKCWGTNNEGQFGNHMWPQTTTTTPHSIRPVDVPGLSWDVVAISAGGFHTCALTSAGGVKCVGANHHGQLGDGSTVLRSLTPVDVSGLTSGVVAISAGRFHTCALMGSGGYKCWGSNQFGQLGDGTTTNSAVPVDVSGFAAPVGDPSASIDSPTSGGIYRVGDVVPTSFSCTEDTGGPGIDTCLDSNGDASPGALDTSLAGPASYTVTATSLSGKTGETQISYTVVTACSPGSWSATGDDRDGPCSVADVGYYVDSAGATAQTACPAGTTTSGTGASSPAACTAASLLERVLAQLEAAHPSGDAKLDKALEKASKAITDALSPELWAGDRLSSKHGHKVFNEIRKAVNELAKVKEPGAFAPEIEAWTGDLVAAARALAAPPVDEAPPGEDKEKALNDLAKGDAEEDASHAVQRYRQAWMKVT